MESSNVRNGFADNLDEAVKEYLRLYKHDLATIKVGSDRTSAVNMCFMRARDLQREKDKPDLFVFTITAYDPENQRWERCPGCGDPDINKESVTGKMWQGCFKCRILLGSQGVIKAMDSSKGAK